MGKKFLFYDKIFNDVSFVEKHMMSLRNYCGRVTKGLCDAALLWPVGVLTQQKPYAS